MDYPIWEIGIGGGVLCLRVIQLRFGGLDGQRNLFLQQLQRRLPSFDICRRRVRVRFSAGENCLGHRHRMFCLIQLGLQLFVVKSRDRFTVYHATSFPRQQLGDSSREFAGDRDVIAFRSPVRLDETIG